MREVEQGERLGQTGSMPSASPRLPSLLPGLLLCAVLAAFAHLVGQVLPPLGSAIPAVVSGILVGALLRRRTGALPDAVAPGARTASKFVLQCGVVLLGAQLSLDAVARVGLESLPVMLPSLAACLLMAWWLGRALGVDRGLRTLIGVGTGICGASAIAAVAPVVRAKSSQVSYAVSTIFLFNVLAIGVFPLLGHALGMDPHAFGLLAGTAVNDTSSVVAAASVFSAASLGFATVVKLVRTLMILPVSFGLALHQARRESGARMSPAALVRLVPWFLVGFLVLTCIVSTGVVPMPVRAALTQLSVFLIAAAMAGIGLSTDVAGMRAAGWKPLALGGLLSLTVLGTTVLMLWGTGSIGG